MYILAFANEPFTSFKIFCLVERSHMTLVIFIHQPINISISISLQITRHTNSNSGVTHPKVETLLLHQQTAWIVIGKVEHTVSLSVFFVFFVQ